MGSQETVNILIDKWLTISPSNSSGNNSIEISTQINISES